MSGPEAREDADDISALLLDQMARGRPYYQRIAARMVGTANADDVVQDAYVKAWAIRSTFRGHHDGTNPDGRARMLRQWLLRAVVRAALNHRAREEQSLRRVTALSELGLPPAPPPDAYDAVHDADRTLDGLDESTRNLVAQALLGEVPSSDDGAPYKRIRRALYRFRRVLRQRWATLLDD
jgi:DNA-directed RNA polymerase specialized sigma24 family protein